MIHLVTGGAGFIGTHVTRELLHIGEEVVVLDDLSSGLEENIPQEAIFVKGSILNNELVKELFKKYTFSNVYHLADYAHQGRNDFFKNFNYSNNLLGSINLINASINHDINCFVFVSSSAVYGRQLFASEDIIPQPEDSFGVAKYAVEMELRCSRNKFGLNYIIFRPHDVYGEYQTIDEDSPGVISSIISQVLSGKPVTIGGNGSQKYAFSYVKEISGVIAKSPWNDKAHGEVFNVGAETIYSVNDAVVEVCSALGVVPALQYVEGANEYEATRLTHHKVKEFFPGQKSYPLKEGVKSTIEWVREATLKEKRFFSDHEINNTVSSLKNRPLVAEIKIEHTSKSDSAMVNIPVVNPEVRNTI